MTISQSVENSKTYIVFTRGSYHNINNMIRSVESGTFINNIKPTFGYSLGYKLPIKLYVGYEGLNLTGNMILQQGEHRLIAENLGAVSGKEVIRIRSF